MTYREHFGSRSTYTDLVGPHEHDAGDISGAFTSVRVRGDIFSLNWDGAIPADLSSAADAAAAHGFYLDGSSGAMQLAGDLYIGGYVTLIGSGAFRTGVQTPLVRTIELTATDPDRINFYSGAATETEPAYLQSVGWPAIALVGPKVTGGPDTAPMLAVDEDTVYARGIDEVLLRIEDVDAWFSLHETHGQLNVPLSMQYRKIWGVSSPSEPTDAASKRWIERSGEWTIAVTGSTVDPDLGTGSTATGYWRRIGAMVFCSAAVLWGSSPSAGGGDYRFNLPFPAEWRRAPIGQGFLLDASEGDQYQVHAYTLDGDNTVCYLKGWSAATDTFYYGADQPVIPAEDDEANFALSYEVLSTLVEFDLYYPGEAGHDGRYLSGTNEIDPENPTSTVLWFEFDGDIFYQYNSDPASETAEYHWDKLAWENGLLVYYSTQDGYADPVTRVEYDPPITMLPQHWDSDEGTWSLSDSSDVDYFEDDVLIKEGVNAWTAEIVGLEEIDGINYWHTRLTETTTWDDESVTNWLTDWYFGPVGGDGSGWGGQLGMYRSVGGNVDLYPVDNWDCIFTEWALLP